MKCIITLFGLFTFVLIFCSSGNNFGELYKVLDSNNTDEIKQHINNGNINSMFPNGYTPLMIAIENNNMEIMQFLVANGANVNLWKTEPNPLIELAKDNNYDLLKKHQTDKTYKDSVLSNGYTPLMLAIRYGNEQIVSYLIKVGADINLPKDKYNPLLVACRNNNFPLVKLLVENKADLNVINSPYPEYPWHNKTPLMYAIKNRNYNMVKYLIDMGTDADFPQNSYNPLLLAIETEQIDIVSLLIKNGSNVNTVDVNALGTNNKSALMYALSHNNMEIVDLLLTHGASAKGSKSIVYALTLDENTPPNMRYKMIEKLIEAGADVNEREGFDGSLYPLDAALPYPDIYDLLVKNGATQFLYDGLGEYDNHDTDN